MSYPTSRGLLGNTILLLILMFSSNAVASVTRSDLTAAYIYRLAENIQWPNSAGISEYRIHIVDTNRNTSQALKTLTRGKRLHGRPLVVTQSRSTSVPQGVHIVYLAPSRSSAFSDVLRQVQNKHILLVSDGVDNKRQISINLFETTSKQVQFEINKANIINQNLGVNPDIILLGGTEIDVAQLYREGQRQLVKLEQQLKDLDAKRITLQKSAEQATKESQLLAKNLDEQKKAVAIEHQKLQKAEEEALRQQADLARQQSELQRQSALIGQQEKDINIAGQRLKEAESKYLQQQKNLESQQKLVLRLKLAIQDEQQRYRDVLDHTEELKAQIENQEQLVSEKLQKYEQLSEKVQQQESALVEQENKIRERAETIQQQDATINKQVNQLEQQEDTIVTQQNYLIGMGIAFVFGVIQAFFILLNYRAKQKANQQLSQQNLVLEETTKQLTQANKAAEQANLSKTVFLTTMSHELRTPLNAILGFSQLMQRDTSLTGPNKEKLGIINSSGEHLLELINDVLELSKIEAGRIVLNISTFDLHRMLNELESIFRGRLEESQVELKFERDKRVPQYIKADQGRLRQILINLLGNAIKFTEHGEISVKTTFSESGASDQSIRLYFDVSDTGVGIDEQDFGKIFTPFEQAADGAQKEGSTGLGLSISQRFAQLMGGDITFSSQKDVGSTFSVAIKAEEGQQSEVEANQLLPTVESLAPDQGDIRVLVVDDYFTNRLMLNKMLANVGFEVREAADGKQAIDVFKEWHPQLILLDVKMPVMDGTEVTKIIKSMPEGKDVVIIVVSASVFEEQKKHILELGASAYINKPVREDVLFTEIQHHLGVSYLYQQQAEEHTTHKLTRYDIAQLPPDFRHKFYQAIQVGDVAQLGKLAKAASQYAPDIGNGLQAMVDNFELNSMQVLFEQDNEMNGGGDNG